MPNIDYRSFKDHYNLLKNNMPERLELPIGHWDDNIDPKEAQRQPIYKFNYFDRLLDSHIFEISENLLTALEKTNPPEDETLLKLPFKNIFLIIDKEVEGTLSRDHDERKKFVLESIFIQEREDFNYFEEEQGEVILTSYIASEKKTGKKHVSHIIGKSADGTNYKNSKATDVASNVEKLVTNFLLFLNQPEVDYRTVERSEKNKERRKRKGKTPLPNDGKIKVTGEIKRYLDKLESEDTEITHDHRYWVRGHWRTLRDEEHWGDKAGTKVWVKPHIRGEGPLVEKDYEVQKTERGEQ